MRSAESRTEQETGVAGRPAAAAPPEAGLPSPGKELKRKIPVGSLNRVF